MKSAQFLLDADKKAFDLEHRRKIRFNIGKYDAAVRVGMQALPRPRAGPRPRRLTSRPRCWKSWMSYLLRIRGKPSLRRAGRVVWANDAEEALAEIGRLTAARARPHGGESQEHDDRGNPRQPVFARVGGIESVETDLGEYIVQLNGERPYRHRDARHAPEQGRHQQHLRQAPGHRSAPTTRSSWCSPPGTCCATSTRRPKSASPGGNFLAGRGRRRSRDRKRGQRPPFGHVSAARTSRWWASRRSFRSSPTSTCSGRCSAPAAPASRSRSTTRCISARASLASPTGRRDGRHPARQRAHQPAGPARPPARRCGCIRCGACLNVCPVYKNIGGHTYETTYSGPIGSVISPHLSGLAEHQHLSFASGCAEPAPACARCASTCITFLLHHPGRKAWPPATTRRWRSWPSPSGAGACATAGPWTCCPAARKDFSLGYLLDQGRPAQAPREPASGGEVVPGIVAGEGEVDCVSDGAFISFARNYYSKSENTQFTSSSVLANSLA
ncbi:MAG: 4Fe-4S dicluster domain-containing protein [Hymenobacter sp.]